MISASEIGTAMRKARSVSFRILAMDCGLRLPAPGCSALTVLAKKSSWLALYARRGCLVLHMTFEWVACRDASAMSSLDMLNSCKRGVLKKCSR